MNQFTNYKSYKKLEKLSQKKIDLTDERVTTAERLKKFIYSAEDFKFFYGLQRIDEEILDALYSLGKESMAVEKMYKMQKGEILNYIKGYESENRKVLHTATRDFFEDRMEEEASSLAFLEIEKLKNFLKNFEDKFTDIVQIGIGGSILGVKSIYNALLCFCKKKIHFISNIDPDEAVSILKKIDLSKTLFISVSKSGTTLETLSNEAFIREEIQKKGINPKDHIVCVTSKGSAMDSEKKYLERFYIWDYICGRFSHTSMVGAVALSFAIGMDSFMEFLKGAHSMDRQVLKEKNLPLLGALLGIWNRNFLKFPTYAVISYSKALYFLCNQLQQYEMESNGKSIDKDGKRVSFSTAPIIWGDIGTNAQHSFFQTLHQGTDIVPIEFIGFQESQYKKDIVLEGTSLQEKLLSNMFAQAIALALGKKDANLNKSFLGNRPSSILFFKRLIPYSLGQLIAYYEHKIVFQGFIWNINSFDQEGVQLGKKLANRIISLFQKKEKFPLAEVFLENFFQ